MKFPLACFNSETRNVTRTRLVPLILAALVFISFHVSAQDHSRLNGLYSNMRTVHGELSGMEMFFLNNGRPGKCDTSVLFQVAEGWPQSPELLECCTCTTRRVEFTSAGFGRFIGNVEDGYLSGEFVEMNYKVRLGKGLSFWQR